METRWFNSVLIVACVVGVLMIVFSRAPTMIGSFDLGGLEIKLNAGYVVDFAVPILFVLLVVLWVIRDDSVTKQKVFRRNRWVLPALLVFPSLASIFMFVQYFLVFAPPGQCNTFDRLTFFLDPKLYGLQPQYCISLPDATQHLMPYIYPPIQTWLYLVLLIASIWLSFRLSKWSWR